MDEIELRLGQVVLLHVVHAHIEVQDGQLASTVVSRSVATTAPSGATRSLADARRRSSRRRRPPRGIANRARPPERLELMDRPGVEQRLECAKPFPLYGAGGFGGYVCSAGGIGERRAVALDLIAGGRGERRLATPLR